LRKDETELHLARFTRIEKDLIARYGIHSQARVFFLYEQLITVRMSLLDRLDDVSGKLLQERCAWLRCEIQGIYNLDSFQTDIPIPVRRPAEDPASIEYDRAVFERRYGRAAELIRHQVVPLDEWRPRVGVRPVGYMYAVDDRGVLLVWDRPFTMSQMLVGRDKVRVGEWTVGHPMLVPDRLRVRAAGEIMPILGGPSGTELRGIVANLKSGHFRPPPQAAAEVVAACRTQAEVPAGECDVFTIPSVPRTAGDNETLEVV